MKSLCVAIALLLLVALWAPAAAQDGGVRVEGRGGFGIPTGALAEMLDIGPALGLSVAFPVARGLAVTVEGTGELFQRDLNVQAWHYLGGIEVSLIEPKPMRSPWTPWSLIVQGAVGGTSFTRLGNGNVVFLEESRTSLLHTSATVGAGLKVSRLVAYSVAIFAEARAILMLTQADDTTGSIEFGSRTVPGFGPQLSIPLMLGLRIRP